ncbi:dihydroorotate dehydrogenase electron transfer subunit [Defluviitalea saccharophila]|uniref:Dihydroorotate dehydrogenase B (NAD(+)), electron transfer subunit n=1 Tax=Defluviitalea saccharophila TaxID=879970 RepID=A0ABZ2Y444_9FIRM
MKEIKHVTVLENQMIAPYMYSMTLQADGIAELAKPGQFVNLYCKGEARLLPRPISICEINKEEGTINLIYAVAGKGTEEFSHIEEGETIEILGPLGNGFMIDESKRRNIVVGGGVGTPPLLELVKQLKGEVDVYLGFRSYPILVEEFERLGARVHIATEDGSVDFKGNVLELMKKENVKGDIIYSCGPKPMLRAISQWAASQNIPMQVSLEERMACGIGVCVGCVCKTRKKDEGDWQHRKVCKDGPVFWSDEVIWDE